MQNAARNFQSGLSAGWINEEDLWIQMLDDRNVTSHTYDEPIAVEIYEHIKNYFPEFKKLSELIRQKHARLKAIELAVKFESLAHCYPS